MEDKQKKKKIVYTIIGIIAVLLVAIAVTYAYWLITKTQTNENVISSGCLDISLTNEVNDITLTNQFPLSDEDGMKLVPYEFTIVNNCASETDYQIALETLDVLDKEEATANSIKVSLNKKGESTIGTKLSGKEIIDPTIDEALEARKLATGTLAAKSEETTDNEVTYELRLWIDANAPVSEINKVFKSKITVSAAQNLNTSTWDGTSATTLAELDINEEAQVVNINNAVDFAGVRDAINKGSLENYTIELNSDIDLNNSNWETIGTDFNDYTTFDETASYFSGTFDGNGHTISNLNVNATEGEVAGLFGAVTGNTTIKNLNIDGGSVTTSGGTAAALVAYSIDNPNLEDNNIVIENVSTNVDVTSIDAASGIIARAYHSGTTTIENCENHGSISGPINKTNVGKAGGILSIPKSSTVKLINNTNYGTVTNGWFTGGILAYIDANATDVLISDCKNYGTIGMDSEDDYGHAVGGIIGLARSQVDVKSLVNSYNYGNIISNDYAGGIVGQISESAWLLENNINEGKITSKNIGGGIIGWSVAEAPESTVTVNTSINKGSVDASLSAGGVIGAMYNNSIINKCKNIAEVTSSEGYVGGLFGTTNDKYYWKTVESTITFADDRSDENLNIDTIGYIGSTTVSTIIKFTNGTPVWFDEPKTAIFGSTSKVNEIYYDDVLTYAYQKTGASEWTIKP